MDISILNIVIWIWNWQLNSENSYLNSKNLFDLKIDIWILNYYFPI